MRVSLWARAWGQIAVTQAWSVAKPVRHYQKEPFCDGRHIQTLPARYSCIIEERWFAQCQRAGDDMSAMIHIDGPKDGDFIARFVTADGRSLAILVPEKNVAVLAKEKRSARTALGRAKSHWKLDNSSWHADRVIYGCSHGRPQQRSRPPHRRL